LFLLANQPAMLALLVRITAILQMNNTGKNAAVLFLFSRRRKKAMTNPWTF
jgi:hypothetical protein